jgi:hypothetical protein
VRTLSDAEVHLLWAWLHDWHSGAGHRAAVAEMSRIPEKSWRDPRFVLFRAYWLNEEGDSAKAEQVLREALRELPDDPRLLNALGYVLLDVQRGTTLEELAPIAAKLAPHANTAMQFHLLARCSELKRALLAGLAYEKRAIALDPGCLTCRSFVAEILDQRGDLRGALDVALLTEGLLRDGARSPSLSAQIDDYRRRLAAQANGASERDQPVEKPTE